ncbi:MAG TPA: TrkA family potassium uptake protein [Anaerolineae bacterium]|nr:TrkA family potassium uptake protein [Anaerolineae bacterium]HOR00797.1 TrkA family potassium uptake protein [Anaerolineae bacterium]HPL29763.1 TrkA family potassium uptake protein [Anaerolineae bacterium]
MYIVTVGGGKVGYYLARSLIEEGHEVLIVERDAAKCARLRDELGVDVLEGDGCEATTLAEAGAARANAVIAVTGDDEDNLVVCQVAKHKFNVARTIARINNPKNQRIFHTLGIDVAVSSTELILSHIKQLLPAQSLLHLLTLHNVGVSFVELELPPNSPAIGRPLRELGIPDDCILPLVVRGGAQAIIPNGNTTLQAGDQVIAVSAEASDDTLRRILCG